LGSTRREDKCVKRRHWVLLAIAAAEGEPLTPVQLQKSLFLLGKLSEKKPKDFYNFVPYNYGPFDAAIYHDAERLSEDGLIIIRQSPGQRWNEYAATASGLTHAKELEAEIPARTAKHLRRLVAWTRPFSFQELVRLIYKLFPAYRVQSVFKD